MKKIKLSQGKFALVDDEDFEWLSQWKWCLTGNGLYAMRNGSAEESRKAILLHRQIMKDPFNKNGLQVDHINSNGLGNQRSNLRLCSQSQNNQNKGKQSNNTSGYKGVSFEPERGKWSARINVNGRQVCLGRFGSPLAAAIAYDKKAIELHGEYAKLNFPLEER